MFDGWVKQKLQIIALGLVVNADALNAETKD